MPTPTPDRAEHDPLMPVVPPDLIPVELEAMTANDRQFALDCACSLYASTGQGGMMSPDTEAVIRTADRFLEWLEKD